MTVKFETVDWWTLPPAQEPRRMVTRDELLQLYPPPEESLMAKKSNPGKPKPGARTKYR